MCLFNSLFFCIPNFFLIFIQYWNRRRWWWWFSHRNMPQYFSFCVYKNIFKVHFIFFSFFIFGGINYDKIIQSGNTAEKYIHFKFHSITTTMMMKRRSINNRVSYTHLKFKESSRQTFIIKNWEYIFNKNTFFLNILNEEKWKEEYLFFGHKGDKEMK